MTKRHLILTLLAALHLGCVICGAARVGIPEQSKLLATGLTTYGDYSGAASGYGFFAPGVSSQWRLVFHIYDSESDKWATEGLPMGNREFELRLSTILGLLAQHDLQEHVAASWAAMVFGKHPAVEFVVVEAQIYVMPTMEQYREGARPQWRTAVLMPFHHQSESSAAGE